MTFRVRISNGLLVIPKCDLWFEISLCLHFECFAFHFIYDSQLCKQGYFWRVINHKSPFFFWFDLWRNSVAMCFILKFDWDLVDRLLFKFCFKIDYFVKYRSIAYITWKIQTKSIHRQNSKISNFNHFFFSISMFFNSPINCVDQCKLESEWEIEIDFRNRRRSHRFLVK